MPKLQEVCLRLTSHLATAPNMCKSHGEELFKSHLGDQNHIDALLLPFFWQACTALGNMRPTADIPKPRVSQAMPRNTICVGLRGPQSLHTQPLGQSSWPLDHGSTGTPPSGAHGLKSGVVPDATSSKPGEWALHLQSGSLSPGRPSSKSLGLGRNPP